MLDIIASGGIAGLGNEDKKKQFYTLLIDSEAFESRCGICTEFRVRCLQSNDFIHILVLKV